MSNHYHAVLRVDAARAEALSDDEVLRRWTQLFTGLAGAALPGRCAAGRGRAPEGG